MNIPPERFSQTIVSALQPAERRGRIAELQGLLNKVLRSAQTLERYQTALYDLIERLSSLGFHLGRWDCDSKVEIWGGSYTDAKAEADLVLRSVFPKGVELVWKDFDALQP